jgi:catechol 2,3-dioxygenase-like lactoylglutathione lyase family enzyme
MPSAPEIKSAKPVLFVTNVETSAAFFRDKLGFTIDFLHGQPPFYGAVSRGGACLHLRGVCEPVFEVGVREEEQLMAAFLDVVNIKALFAEYKSAGASFVHPLRKEPWGGSTFTVRDPDGNAICFAQSG